MPEYDANARDTARQIAGGSRPNVRIWVTISKAAIMYSGATIGHKIPVGGGGIKGETGRDKIGVNRMRQQWVVCGHIPLAVVYLNFKKAIPCPARSAVLHIPIHRNCKFDTLDRSMLGNAILLLMVPPTYGPPFADAVVA